MTDIYSKVIMDDDYRQVRLTVSEFRDKEYLHLREYYLDFNEEWMPTDRGIHIPLEISSTLALFEALSEILSLAENKEVLETFFAETIRDLYKKV